MSFVPSVYSFGDYTFPIGFVLVERDQDSRIDTVDIPMRDGSLAPAGVEAAKSLRLVGQVGGNGAVDSSGNYITTRDQCTAELNLMASYLRQGYQQLKAGDADGRYIWAQKQKFVATYEPGCGGRIAQVEIQFLAQDPRWLSAATNTHDFGAGGTANVDGAGSAIAYPQLTVHGPFTNPYLQITPAGESGSVKVTATVALVAGDVLVIDCDPRNRANALLLNGAPRLDLLGTSGSVNTLGNDAYFPYLSPGTNSVTAGAAGGNGSGSDITLTWQDAWSF